MRWAKIFKRFLSILTYRSYSIITSLLKNKFGSGATSDFDYFLSAKILKFSCRLGRF